MAWYLVKTKDAISELEKIVTKWHATLMTFIWTLSGIIEYLFSCKNVYNHRKGSNTHHIVSTMSIASLKGLRLLKSRLRLIK